MTTEEIQRSGTPANPRLPNDAQGPSPAGSRAGDAKALRWIIALVYERSRIRLNDGKEPLIRARLGKRMRALGIGSLSEYCDLLRLDSAEVGRAIDALTTNFTHFLREREHCEFMVQQALPSLRVSAGRPFRVWSAACASGEEPFTIGFYLAEHFPLASGWNWQIHATDISTKVLDKAIQGVYPDEKLQPLPAAWVHRYFQRGVGKSAGLCRVKSFLRDRISFEHLNLLGDQCDVGKFEIIFCRNVMIYFDRPTQERLAKRLSEMLVDNGYLFTGRAESLNGLAVPFRCLSPSIYRKT